MTDIDDVEAAVVNLNRDLQRFGECGKILMSPRLFEALRCKLEFQGSYLGLPGMPKGGTVLFQGVPILECVLLQDLEYALVRTQGERI